MKSRAQSAWSAPETVAGFASSPPNLRLMQLAGSELARLERGRALDIGGGAGRNAVPLARARWDVVCLDISRNMIDAAAARVASEGLAARLMLSLAGMDALPVAGSAFDLVIAHGIWNLAGSAAEFRRAVGEAARAARPGGLLFVFTFSRNTLAPDATPVPGEPFVFTDFAGYPQCFLTADQLVRELGSAGFAPDPEVPLLEHNLPRPGALRSGGPPVIYEGGFRRVT